MKLDQLKPNAAIRGIVPDALVTVVNVQWFGSEALELTYKTASGKVANELIYRHDEPRLELVEQGRPPRRPPSPGRHCACPARMRWPCVPARNCDRITC